MYLHLKLRKFCKAWHSFQISPVQLNFRPVCQFSSEITFVSNKQFQKQYDNKNKINHGSQNLAGDLSVNHSFSTSVR